MKIPYKYGKMRAASLAVVSQANSIIEEYRSAGYDLTLRQLYYQFVARDLIPNTQKEYKRLGNIISEGRLLGLVRWDVIEDRTRNVETPSYWESPEDLVEACADQFKLDLWATQPYYVEVWVEKEALGGVVARACEPLRVPYFCCRGYVSQSEMWRAAQRFPKGKPTLIIHLGDHDPSGIDMTRDIEDRLQVFAGGKSLAVARIALNMHQVDTYNPPPNPAKVTDSRFESYYDEYGGESWELDALPPNVLDQLIADAVEQVVDDAAWQEAKDEEEEGRDTLYTAAREMREAKTT